MRKEEVIKIIQRWAKKNNELGTFRNNLPISFDFAINDLVRRIKKHKKPPQKAR